MSEPKSPAGIIPLIKLKDALASTRALAANLEQWTMDTAEWMATENAKSSQLEKDLAVAKAKVSELQDQLAILQLDIVNKRGTDSLQAGIGVIMSSPEIDAQWSRAVDTLGSMCISDKMGNGPTRGAFIMTLRLYADEMGKLIQPPPKMDLHEALKQRVEEDVLIEQQENRKPSSDEERFEKAWQDYKADHEGSLRLKHHGPLTDKDKEEFRAGWETSWEDLD